MFQRGLGHSGLRDPGGQGQPSSLPTAHRSMGWKPACVEGARGSARGFLSSLYHPIMDYLMIQENNDNYREKSRALSLFASVGLEQDKKGC